MPDRAQTILVIEDDPAVGEALVEGISTEGYEVHWETTGGGGVEFARDHSPQLIENVWGSDADFYDDKTVRVHVRRLREKVEHEPSSPSVILTVPGIGYRLGT